MLRVKVELPFHRKETDTLVEWGDVIVVSEEELQRIKAINVNMVSVLGEEPQPRKRKTKEVKEGE